MVIFVIYISAFSSFISSAVSPVISMIDASSIPFASIFLAISRLRRFMPSALPSSQPCFIPFSMPISIPSRLAVSTEFLMSRYAILLVSYSLISCGVNLAISASSKRRSKSVSKLIYLSSTCFIRFMFLFVMQRLCQRAQ